VADFGLVFWGRSIAMAQASAASFPAELELSIVMPCLDEAETLGRCIEKATAFLRENGIAGEVVVADNGSRDASPDIARRLGARVVPVTTPGYGAALMGGIEAARGRYVIMGDADDSYDFSALAPFVERLRAGDELVMGNRFRGGIADGAMPPLHRYFGNPFLSRVGDFQCGLRGFSKEAFARLDMQTLGMEFASEMVVKASLKGLRVSEVPTTLSPDGRSRRPHLRTFRDGWRYLRFLLLYSPRWLFLYPGIALMLLGFAVGAAILPGSLRVGRLGFDAQSLIYAGMAILIGFQAVVFAVFSKVFAIREGLLPEDPRLQRAMTHVTLEGGLVVGALLVVCGLAGSLYAVGVWGESAFGELNPLETLRLIVPSAVSLTLGFQLVLCSFFLSVLGLRRR
jgi:glycosyltransferase involved in cell wall biosynthesis